MKKTILSALAFCTTPTTFAHKVQDIFIPSLDVHIDPVPVIFSDPSLRFGTELKAASRWAVK